MAGLEESSQKSENEAWKPSPRVVFDIGGTKFAMSLETANKIPDCLLQQIVTGHLEVPPEEDGSYFIDRDATWFPYVLTYLRRFPDTFKTETSIVQLTLNDRYELLKDAIFYKLPKLEALVRTYLSKLLKYADWDWFKIGQINRLRPVNRYDSTCPAKNAYITSVETVPDVRVFVGKTDKGLIACVATQQDCKIWTKNADAKVSRWIQQASHISTLTIRSSKVAWFGTALPPTEYLNLADGQTITLPIGAAESASSSPYASSSSTNESAATSSPQKSVATFYDGSQNHVISSWERWVSLPSPDGFGIPPPSKKKQ